MSGLTTSPWPHANAEVTRRRRIVCALFARREGVNLRLGALALVATLEEREPLEEREE